jgi:hypothetical protein
MGAIQYFAYGSNMLSERLKARCPSARACGTACADGYTLSFTKKSSDGSGKATLYTEAGRQAFGVVFELDEDDLKNLDKAEGVGNGYDRIGGYWVRVQASGEQMKTVTYLASPEYIDQSLKPYDWYLSLVLAGARQHGLPSEYIEALAAVPSICDSKPKRKSRLEALGLLRERPSGSS